MYINIKTENLLVRTKFYWSRDGGLVIIVRTVLGISDDLLFRILFFMLLVLVLLYTLYIHYLGFCIDFVVSFFYNIHVVYKFKHISFAH